MEKYVLAEVKLWHYIIVIFIFGFGSIWWILDFLYIHRTQYSIHKIFNLPDNFYKFLCIVFLCISLFALIYFYSIFINVNIDDNTILLYYLKPHPTVSFPKSFLKSYEIKTTKANNRILVIHLRNGKTYKSAGTSPEDQEYNYQFEQLTGAFDKIIEANKSPAYSKSQ